MVYTQGLYTCQWFGKLHVISLDYLKLSDSSLTLNLATGIGHTVLEIVRKVETLSSLKVNYKFVGKRIYDPSSIISRTKF